MLLLCGIIYVCFVLFENKFDIIATQIDQIIGINRGGYIEGAKPLNISKSFHRKSE